MVVVEAALTGGGRKSGTEIPPVADGLEQQHGHDQSRNDGLHGSAYRGSQPPMPSTRYFEDTIVEHDVIYLRSFSLI